MTKTRQTGKSRRTKKTTWRRARTRCKRRTRIRVRRRERWEFCFNMARMRTRRPSRRTMRARRRTWRIARV